MPGATSWCRCRGRQLRGAERAAARGVLPPALAIGCAVTPRRSASGWSATWPPCISRCRRPTTPARRSRAVSSLSLVRYRGNDYSVPTAYGHREVLDPRLRRRGGDLLRRRDHRPASALLRARGLRLRPAALPGAARAEDRRPRPGGAAGRLGPARGVRHAAPPARGPHGQARQARVRPGPAAAGDLPARGRGRRRQRGHRPRRDRLRCGQAPGAVPDRAAAAAARPDGLSLPAAGDGGDDLGQGLPGPARRAAS